MGAKDTRRRRPQQARSRATVNIILEAAAQVLVTEGPQGATTNRIAERAGVSVGTVYQYFSDKKALYTALGERLVESLGALFTSLAPRLLSAPLSELLPGLLDPLLARISEDPVLNGVLHVTALPPRDFEAIEIFEREAAVALEMLIRSQPRLTARLPDPALSARLIVRAVSGAIARTLASEPTLVTEPRFRDELVRLIDGYLGGALSAPPED